MRRKFLVAVVCSTAVASLAAQAAPAQESDNASCVPKLNHSEAGPPGLFHVEFGLGMAGFGRVVREVAQIHTDCPL